MGPIMPPALKLRNRSIKRLLRSKGGISQIIAELMMVLIVLIMSVTVFVFYSGVFGALLTGVSLHPENFTIVGAGAPNGFVNASAVQPSGSAPSISTSGVVCDSSHPI